MTDLSHEGTHRRLDRLRNPLDNAALVGAAHADRLIALVGDWLGDELIEEALADLEEAIGSLRFPHPEIGAAAVNMARFGFQRRLERAA